tara:strand:+ start:109 stop:759 length:651 start_codon:yes stop_codon:yes gene_type:complete
MALYKAIQHARNLDDHKLLSILETAQKEEWYAKESAKIREMLLVSESQRESVDREAHVARISERQRFLFEKSCASSAGASSLIHAVGGAAFVEQSLSLLCPFLESRTPGSQACVLRLRADECKRLARLEAEELSRQKEETRQWKAQKCERDEVHRKMEERELFKGSQEVEEEEAKETVEMNDYEEVEEELDDDEKEIIAKSRATNVSFDESDSSSD